MINDINTATGFRGDINGLRAWAVVAVILYHFGVPGFGGGFVGVDVFFVISGFLMTGIVVRGLERGGGLFAPGVLHGQSAPHPTGTDRALHGVDGVRLVGAVAE